MNSSDRQIMMEREDVGGGGEREREREKKTYEEFDMHYIDIHYGWTTLVYNFFSF